MSHVTHRICPFLRPAVQGVMNGNDLFDRNTNAGVKQKPQVCIVTGANTGIGFQTCVELCSRGSTVVLACRSRDKGEKAIDDISKRSLTGKAIFIEPLDLSSFASVKSFASSFLREFPDGLNVLVVSLFVDIFL